MQEEVHRQSAVDRARGNQIPWGWVAVTAVVLEIAIVLSAFAWVSIYSYLIHPGEQATYYENYAQSASPIVSIALGIPYWFFACRWVGRKAGTHAVATSLWIWLVLFIVDLSLSFLGKATIYNWAMVAISGSTKMLAAYLGGKDALKGPLRRLRF